MMNFLKGDDFQNRYRITGKLKTLSPLHIGTGEESDKLFSEQQRNKYTERIGKVPAVSTVIKDHRGKPLIPGSALRGVLRHWLLSVLNGVGNNWVAVREYEDNALIELSQDEQIQKARNEFSTLERLFGTPFNAGKLEIWDARCTTTTLPVEKHLLNWNNDSLTYIDTSVAIDPNTGTAMDKLLYKAEVVPTGVEFELNLVAQNLSDDELGLVLFALQGFNSLIYPIHLGARAGRGYGRLRFIPGNIFMLKKEGIRDWVRKSIQAISFDQPDTTNQSAANFALPVLRSEKQKELINSVKTKMLAELGG